MIDEIHHTVKRAPGRTVVVRATTAALRGDGRRCHAWLDRARTACDGRSP
jgi:hypothetical protein